MPLDTLTISVDDSSPPHGENNARVLRTDFGDGYSQRAAQGINNVDKIWNITSIPYSSSDAQTFDEFFRTHGGYTAFYWTPPGHSEPLKFTCSKWSLNGVQGSNLYYRVTATLRREFDL
jgi:phage-related protein